SCGRAPPAPRAAWATAKSSSCRCPTASASAPASAARRRSDMAPPEVVLLSDDLIFTSRIAGEAGVHGVAVKAAKTAGELLDLARGPIVVLAIVDLAHPGPRPP